MRPHPFKAQPLTCYPLYSSSFLTVTLHSILMSARYHLLLASMMDSFKLMSRHSFAPVVSVWTTNPTRRLQTMQCELAQIFSALGLADRWTLRHLAMTGVHPFSDHRFGTPSDIKYRAHRIVTDLKDGEASATTAAPMSSERFFAMCLELEDARERDFAELRLAKLNRRPVPDPRRNLALMRKHTHTVRRYFPRAQV
jgi:hypothetical protein